MKLQALVLTLLLCCLAVPPTTSATVDKRIINGSPSELYSHPYIVSLQQYSRLGWASYGWTHSCGGSLIARGWVLTAAHCVDTITSRTISNLRVEMGAMNLYLEANSYEQTVGVSQVIVHGGWDGAAPGMPHDIALLKLSAPAQVNSNVKVAQLAGAGDSFLDETCVLAGWGQMDNGQLAQELKEVSITKISTASCRFHWGAGITDSHICVHDASPPVGDRPSACMGDSGGPMMCGRGHNILAGVTSWGESTCSGDMPSVYTRVSAYLAWIQQFVDI